VTSQIPDPPDRDLDEALVDLQPDERAALIPVAARLRDRPLPSPQLRSAVRSKLSTQRPLPVGSPRLAFGSILCGIVLFGITALGLGGLGPLSA
jgi:hypothetical protein